MSLASDRDLLLLIACARARSHSSRGLRAHPFERERSGPIKVLARRCLAWDRAVDDRRIVSAIVFVIKNGLRCRDPGLQKTIDNQFVRWSRVGVFKQDFRRTGGARAASWSGHG